MGDAKLGQGGAEIRGLMQVEWKSRTEYQYLFRQQAEWSGIRVRRARVTSGRMLERTADCHEINVTIAGKGTTQRVSANGRLITTRGKPGGFCLTPAGQSVSGFWDEPLDHLGILLRPEFVRETAVENHIGPDFELVEVYGKRDPLLTQLGLALLHEVSSDTLSGRLYADSLIQTLTLHVLKSYTTAGRLCVPVNGGLSGYKLRRVKDFIGENLEKDLGLIDLSTVAGLSQFHFARAFKKSTGRTPQHYLMERRIEKAKELLTNDDLPLVEVSLRAGFKSQSHFTTLFRKFTNLTPKAWRQRHFLRGCRETGETRLP